MQWDDIFASGTERFLPQRINIADIPTAEELDQNVIKLSDHVSFADSFNLTSPAMADRAATVALNQSGHRAQDIAAIIYAKLDEADHLASVCHLQRVLGIPDTLAFELGAASDGGAMGLEVAASLLKTDTSAKAALVTAVGRFQLPRWSNRWVSGVVLSDGSAAAVLSRGRGLARLVVSAHSSIPKFETLCTLRAANADANTTPKTPIEETGLGPYADDLKEGVINVVERVLRETGIKLADIAKFAVTGIGLAQLSVIVLESLGITPDRTTWPFLREIGHTGPCDPLLGLDYLLRQGRFRQGDLLLVLGMGVGFRYTCTLLEVGERENWGSLRGCCTTRLERRSHGPPLAQRHALPPANVQPLMTLPIGSVKNVDTRLEREFLRGGH